MNLANKEIEVHLRVRVPRCRVDPEYLTGYRLVKTVHYQVSGVRGGISDELLDKNSHVWILCLFSIRNLVKYVFDYVKVKSTIRMFISITINV